MSSPNFRLHIFLGLILSLGLISCAPVGKTTVWKNRNFSFSQFEISEVQQVVNATGKAVPKNALESITHQLKTQLGTLDLLTAKPFKGDALIIRSELLAYGVFKPAATGLSLRLGGPAKSMCTLRTHLALKTKATPVATVVTTQETGASIYNSMKNFDNRVLTEAAKVTARRIAVIMHGPGEL